MSNSDFQKVLVSVREERLNMVDLRESIKDVFSGGAFDVKEFRKMLGAIPAKILLMILTIMITCGPNWTKNMSRVQTVKKRDNLSRKMVEMIDSILGIEKMVTKAGMKFKSPTVPLGPNVITASRIIQSFPTASINILIGSESRRNWANRSVKSDLAMNPVLVAFVLRFLEIETVRAGLKKWTSVQFIAFCVEQDYVASCQERSAAKLPAVTQSAFHENSMKFLEKSVESMVQCTLKEDKAELIELFEQNGLRVEGGVWSVEELLVV